MPPFLNPMTFPNTSVAQQSLNNLTQVAGATAGHVLTKSGSDAVWAAASGSGTVIPGICQGRLTTESGVGVSSSDRTSQSTIYFTPWNGNQVALYDGSAWAYHAMTERSLSLSGLTLGKNYDVFIYNNAGTLTLELSAAWTNDTTRANAITTQNGVYVKSGATTRLYVGTIRTTGTTTTEDSAKRRFVWNLYNPWRRQVKKNEHSATANWTYTTVAFRAANNDSNNRVEVVSGLAGSSIDASVFALAGGNSTGNSFIIAIGEDSTTAASADCVGRQTNTFGSAADFNQVSARLNKPVPLGYHYYAWLEKAGVASGTTTWYATDGDILSGIIGDYEC